MTPHEASVLTCPNKSVYSSSSAPSTTAKRALNIRLNQLWQARTLGRKKKWVLKKYGPEREQECSCEEKGCVRPVEDTFSFFVFIFPLLSLPFPYIF